MNTVEQKDNENTRTQNKFCSTPVQKGCVVLP